jgi:hypothetical protein
MGAPGKGEGGMSKVEKKAHVFQRDPHDWYVENQACTRALLRVERFFGTVWNPACGQGNIMRACRATGLEAVGSDVVRRAGFDDDAWWCGVGDFLQDSRAPSFESIITNPPFFKAKGTEAFIRKALRVARHKVAIFTDVKFLAGGARASGLYAEHPPSRVWILSPRPSCPPGEWLKAGNKAGGGTADWVWAVWSLTEPRQPTQLNWLRILPEDAA